MEGCPENWLCYDCTRRNIRLIDGNAKCHHQKNWPVNGFWGRCLSVWGPLPLLGFRLGWSSNFVASWIWSDTECKTPAEYGLQQNPLPYTLYTSIQYLHTYSHREGGESWTREKRKEKGNRGEHRLQSWVKNTNMIECTQEIDYLQYINSDKNLPQSPFTGHFS